MKCLHGLAVISLLYCLCFVSVTYCLYWTTSPARVDINMDLVGGHMTAFSVLSCTRFCNKFFFYYFSYESRQCYCSKKSETFSEDLSKEEIILGESKPLKDCLEYHHAGFVYDDYYIIEPRPGSPVTVWCDMENGGWTDIQRRLDGSVDFYRNWTEYARGFGDTDGEIWLGLDNIHALTQDPSELHIAMETFGDVNPVAGYARYSYFSVANASLLYRLSMSIVGYSGNITDSMYQNSNGRRFTTYDVDNDCSRHNCAILYISAWWHCNCVMSNLNGYYYGGHHTREAAGVNWLYPWGFHYSLKKVTMKVRRLTS